MMVNLNKMLLMAKEYFIPWMDKLLEAFGKITS
jgi:hypothetical protein